MPTSTFGSARPKTIALGITSTTRVTFIQNAPRQPRNLTGNSRSKNILNAATVEGTKKVSDLNEDEVNRIRQVIEQQGDVEGDLRKDISMHIKRLIEIGSYRGFRHRRSLPVRGQRTHTNARTRKGPRKGTVANKKKASAKT